MGIGRYLCLAVPRWAWNARDLREWRLRGWSAPSPPHVKRAVIARLGLPGAVWIESGTYFGDTAAILARFGSHVYTIEPDPTLHARAVRRLSSVPNVTVVHGCSEEVLPDLLKTLDGDANFWLDGHYSGGVTHQGPTDCPIAHELEAIASSLDKLGSVTLLIDDLRCFEPSIPEYRDYPTRDYLVEWAKIHGFGWHVEHDVMCMRRTGPGRGLTGSHQR